MPEQPAFNENCIVSPAVVIVVKITIGLYTTWIGMNAPSTADAKVPSELMRLPPKTSIKNRWKGTHENQKRNRES